jgi:hypothetical protein
MLSESQRRLDTLQRSDWRRADEIQRMKDTRARAAADAARTVVQFQVFTICRDTLNQLREFVSPAARKDFENQMLQMDVQSPDKK